MRELTTRGVSHSSSRRSSEAIPNRTWLKVMAGVFFFRSPGFDVEEPTGQ